jgi:hypothetical protein
MYIGQKALWAFRPFWTLRKSENCFSNLSLVQSIASRSTYCDIMYYEKQFIT